MGSKYDKMSQEEFDDILGDIVQEDKTSLLDIAGVHEILSEHFNNDVIERWSAKMMETHRPVEFLLAYEDKTWDTEVIWTPLEVADEELSHDKLMSWVLSTDGPSQEVQYNKVVSWSVYNFEPDADEES